jgi:hypothetical protein
VQGTHNPPPPLTRSHQCHSKRILARASVAKPDWPLELKRPGARRLERECSAPGSIGLRLAQIRQPRCSPSRWPRRGCVGAVAQPGRRPRRARGCEARWPSRWPVCLPFFLFFTFYLFSNLSRWATKLAH